MDTWRPGSANLIPRKCGEETKGKVVRSPPLSTTTQAPTHTFKEWTLAKMATFLMGSVAQDNLELTMSPRLAPNPRSSCLRLLRAGIIVVPLSLKLYIKTHKFTQLLSQFVSPGPWSLFSFGFPLAGSKFRKGVALAWGQAWWAISLIFASVGTTEPAPSLACIQSLPVIRGKAWLAQHLLRCG